MLASRAAYWTRRRTLLVADVHLGKAATFQHFGLGVPDGADAGTTHDDLSRLTRLIETTGAERRLIQSPVATAWPAIFIQPWR